MRIMFYDRDGRHKDRWVFPHLDYSDHQVRYEIGKFRAVLDLLNEKGRAEDEARARNYVALDDPILNE